MIFYEVELFTQPEFIFAYSVEIANYQNAFRQKKNFLEISLITEGRILYEYTDGSSDLVEPGMLTPILSDLDCRTSAPFKEMQCHTTVGALAEYRYLRHDTERDFDPAALEARMARGRVILLPFHEQIGEKEAQILSLLKKTISKVNSPRPSDRVAALGSWYALCAELTEVVLDKLNKTHTSLPPSALLYIQKAKQYMAEHYRENLTVGEIAATLRISTGYLHNLFKQATGNGVMAYFTGYRMELVKQLIVSRRISLAEAARHIGIEDPAYMSRLFKKTCGVSYSRFLQDAEQNVRKNDTVHGVMDKQRS